MLLFMASHLSQKGTSSGGQAVIIITDLCTSNGGKCNLLYAKGSIFYMI